MRGVAEASKMNRWCRALATLAATMSLNGATLSAAAGGGTVIGRVRLSGPPPGNTVIRMGVDPMCSRVNARKRILQETVMTDKAGGLANVFVRVVGTFPQAPVPTQPVIIDQRGCVYVPRVVGLRVGQVLQVKNSDPLLHNVHSASRQGNVFNIGQPVAGITNDFRFKNEEIMMPIRCDLHRWMTTYVGIITHPYFAVSGTDGTFAIESIPPGSYMVETWHERYGKLTKPVRVLAGAPVTLDFSYTGTEQTPPEALKGDAASPRGRGR